MIVDCAGSSCKSNRRETRLCTEIRVRLFDLIQFDRGLWIEVLDDLFLLRKLPMAASFLAERVTSSIHTEKEKRRRKREGKEKEKEKLKRKGEEALCLSPWNARPSDRETPADRKVKEEIYVCDIRKGVER
uniref:Uncharacterized protein n=1 Tax=Vespula pensylvanica TaxID=30213 RepID=A0A834P6D6_VESPE|nr:hypothetical protein H0235_006270 [Vespula pensylvanica]